MSRTLGGLKRYKVSIGWAGGWCVWCGALSMTEFCGEACRDGFRVADSPSWARYRVLHRDRGICAHCGADVSDRLPGQPHRWEADHVIPVEDGGLSALENLQTLCIPCHREKTLLRYGAA
jgi:5-methylcytosine-specific restriction enzyme A